jgi:hypothetical protein
LQIYALQDQRLTRHHQHSLFVQQRLVLDLNQTQTLAWLVNQPPLAFCLIQATFAQFALTRHSQLVGMVLVGHLLCQTLPFVGQRHQPWLDIAN